MQHDKTKMDILIDTITNFDIPLAVCNDFVTITRSYRGVRGIWSVWEEYPEVLRGGDVADKVIGKGAAAVMAYGGARRVYGIVMSRPALELLQGAGIETTYGTLVDNIINREGTGICPVEALCADCSSPEECIPLIRNFLNNK